MIEAGNGSVTVSDPSHDVALFSKRYRLEKSVGVTEKLLRSAFGESLAGIRVTVEDDIDEEDELEQMLVVDFTIKDTQSTFHRDYGGFISAWVNSVPAEHHKFIQFRFHIVES